MTPAEIDILISTALAGKHNDVGNVHSAYEYEVAHMVKKATLKLSKYFKLTYDSLFKQYIKARKKNDKNMTNLLIAARDMNLCSVYYKEEANLIQTKMDIFANWIKEHLFDD